MVGCFALAVAIAFVIVRIAYMFVDTSAGHTAPSVYGNASGTSASFSKPDKVDTSAIAMWSLFGKEGQKAVVKEAPKDVNAPKTRLSLELQAVFVAPVEERSTAMIAESRKDSKLYRIGDKVPGNVTLAAVHQDRVLLNRNGNLEALYFSENSQGGLSRSSSSSRSRSNKTSRRSTSSSRRTNPRDSMPGNLAGGSSGGLTAEARSAMASQMVSSLKEQVAENADAVLGQFGLVPNNGRGYKVSESANPMLMAIGAKPGDLILSVNGVQVGDPTQDINLIEEVMSQGTVRATLERNGTQFDSEIAIPGV